MLRSSLEAVVKGRRKGTTALASTREKTRARFLAALAGPAAGSVPTAAKAVGVSRSLPHLWAKADESFAAKMAEAKALGEQVALAAIEAEIDRRAVEGVEEPVFQKGELVGHIRRYSDLLLMFRAKKLNPAYRDHQPGMFEPGSVVVNIQRFGPPAVESQAPPRAALGEGKQE